jgi:hypothetical protein
VGDEERLVIATPAVGAQALTYNPPPDCSLSHLWKQKLATAHAWEFPAVPDLDLHCRADDSLRSDGPESGA